MDRLTKQIIIALIFMAIVGGICFGIYRSYNPAATCTDGIKNQSEQGVDCGPVCGRLCEAAIEPLEIVETKLILAGGNEFDAVATVRNPNTFAGAYSVGYTLTLLDAQAQAVATRTGVTYILPGQRRWIVVEGIPRAGIVTAELTLAEPSWSREVSRVVEIDLPIIREQFIPASDQSASRYEAVIANRSNYTLDRVDVAIILFDQADQIIGTAMTNIRTVAPGEQRYFQVSWPLQLAGMFDHAQVQVVTNALNPTNFIKRDGTPESDQDFR